MAVLLDARERTITEGTSFRDILSFLLGPRELQEVWDPKSGETHIRLFHTLGVIEEAISNGRIRVSQFDMVFNALVSAAQTDTFFESREVVISLTTRLKEYMDGYRAGEKAILSAVTY